MDIFMRRLEKKRKMQERRMALMVCLSILVTFATFAGFHIDAVTKVYTVSILDCPYADEDADVVAHVHNDDCLNAEGINICSLPEIEPHLHTEACYLQRNTLFCSVQESNGHRHDELCVSRILNCGETERDSISDENEILLDPEHVHTEDCYAEFLVCNLAEGEGEHHHSDACYQVESVFTCGKEECTLPVHVHDSNCFYLEELTGEDEIGDGEENKTQIEDDKAIQEEAQRASEDRKADDIKEEKAYLPEMPISDPDSDLESSKQWERDFENLELTGNLPEDLVRIAKTQLGKGESRRNFEAIQIEEEGAWCLKGYTRYGAWFGEPYAEWSAKFVSFCLYYAGIPSEVVPRPATSDLMAQAFLSNGMLTEQGTIPSPGDLIFFDTDEDAGIDHMGIVLSADEEKETLTTIEGDRTDFVDLFEYSLHDEEIVGYGILPQNRENSDAEENGNINQQTESDDFSASDERNEADITSEMTDSDEAAAALPMPEQSFLNYAGGIIVAVEAPEGAFPEMTAMGVTPVNGNGLKTMISEALSCEVLEVQAVDIAFLYDGSEIEPMIPIQVSITPELSPHSEQMAQIVHIDDSMTAELIEHNGENLSRNSEFVFEAEAFSIYAVVYMPDSVRLGNVSVTDLQADGNATAIEPGTLQLTVQEVRDGNSDLESMEENTENVEATIVLKRYRAEIPAATLHFKMTDDQSSPDDDVINPAGSAVALTTENDTNIKLTAEDNSSSEDINEDSIVPEMNGEEAVFTLPDNIGDACLDSQENPENIEVTCVDHTYISDDNFSEDTDYVGAVATIKSGSTETFHNLQLSETDGDRVFVYRYYVEEMPLDGFTTQYQIGSGTWQESISPADAVGNERAETITIKNTEESSELGSLKISQQVTVGQCPIDEINGKLTNGIYKFTITGNEDCFEAFHTVMIRYEDGEIAESKLDENEVSVDEDGFVEISCLKPGEYVITEEEPQNGMVLSDITGGIKTDLDNKTAIATVTSGQSGEGVEDTGKVSFTSDYASKELTIKKVWGDAQNRGSVSVQLLRTTADVHSVRVELQNTEGTIIKTLNGFVAAGDDAKVTWNTKDVSYILSVNGHEYKEDECRLVTSRTLNTLTMKNVQEDLKIEVMVKEKISNALFDTYSSKTNNCDISISHIALNNNNNWEKKLILKGSLDGSNNEFLKQYNEQGKEYHYFILEYTSSQSDDYTTWYKTETGPTEETLYVYNGVPEVSVAGAELTIHKLGEQGQSLKGAVFCLMKKEEGDKYELVSESPLNSKGEFTVPEEGFMLSGLTDGEYQIQEISPPEGYVLTENLPIAFTVSGENVRNTTVSEKRGVVFESKSESKSASFTIINTPGPMLPETGGKGTGVYLLSGILTTLTASVILTLQRRKQSE